MVSRPGTSRLTRPSHREFQNETQEGRLTREDFLRRLRAMQMTTRQHHAHHVHGPTGRGVVARMLG